MAELKLDNSSHYSKINVLEANVTLAYKINVLEAIQVSLFRHVSLNRDINSVTFVGRVSLIIKDTA